MLIKTKELKPCGIIGTGFYVPDVVVTNKDVVEKCPTTTEEFIKERIGVVERRICKPEQSLSDMALIAAQRALEDAKIAPLEIDFIVVAASMHDYIMPSTACTLNDLIGAYNAAAIDIRAACGGWVYALSIASHYIQDGTFKNVLLVGAECHSKMMNWSDRNTAPFFGDGAGAAILQPSDGTFGLMGSYIGAYGHANDAIIVEAGGSRLPASEETVKNKQHCIKMDGKRVADFVSWAFPWSVTKACRDAGINVSDLDFIISHQANARLIEKCMKDLQLPMSKTYINIHKYGNTSAASIPIAYHEAKQKGLIKKGDKVAIVGFGAGFTFGSVVIKV